ncbi:hypothetical protein ACH4U5_22305 [Streptomyces sp. NPDC020858]|uniref:hypothetical protein n=1 Tax=Streptomyces sp. NPDC020858 TaxID=3365097 RepID=UPI0037ABAACE
MYHDVWGTCDFRGEPHPATHANNAPRLASALQELDQVLGVAAEPGEPTYYGRAEGCGLGAPDVIDGRGPDLTDAAVGWLAMSALNVSCSSRSLTHAVPIVHRAGGPEALGLADYLTAVGDAHDQKELRMTVRNTA